MKILSIFLFLLFHYRQAVNALDFGVCEVIIPQLVVTNLSTPYWINKRVQGCCNGFIKTGDKCLPNCEKVTCLNSYCIGNNTCQCNAGYEQVDVNKCSPSCDPPCSDNMECTEPNHCNCKRDFRRVNETHCEPICSFTEEDFDCINARCYEPNKCQCYDGYSPISEFECEPICVNCENGTCVAPDTCECNEGFEKNSEGTCRPKCTPECINGDCIRPGVCRCHKNFQKFLISHECLEANVIKDRQDCRRTCTHGSCNKNGTCICNYGYDMHNGKCLKICNKKCINGKCLEDQCICPPDYKLSTENSTCIPICSFEDGHDCINGNCIAPNICECFSGYRFLDNRNCTCVPICNPPCINGYCTNDGCICHENFYNISNYECIKNCSQGYSWLYDECVMNSDLDDMGLNDYRIDTSTIETTTVLETTTEHYTTITEILEETTRYIMVEKSKDPELPMTTLLIVVLSAVFFLLICIFITFYILYNFIYPKHIYFIEQQEQSENCVYFTKQQERKSTIPVTEFNI